MLEKAVQEQQNKETEKNSIIDAMMHSQVNNATIQTWYNEGTVDTKKAIVSALETKQKNIDNERQKLQRSIVMYKYILLHTLGVINILCGYNLYQLFLGKK